MFSIKFNGRNIRGRRGLFTVEGRERRRAKGRILGCFGCARRVDKVQQCRPHNDKDAHAHPTEEAKDRKGNRSRPATGCATGFIGRLVCAR